MGAQSFVSFITNFLATVKLVVMRQFSDHVNIKFISQLVIDISKAV